MSAVEVIARRRGYRAAGEGSITATPTRDSAPCSALDDEHGLLVSAGYGVTNCRLAVNHFARPKYEQSLPENRAERKGAIGSGRKDNMGNTVYGEGTRQATEGGKTEPRRDLLALERERSKSISTTREEE